MQNPGEALKIVLHSDIQSLLIVALFALPLLLASWTYLLNQLKLKPKFILIANCVLVGLFGIGLILSFQGKSKNDRYAMAEAKIIDYLDGRNLKLASFGLIQDDIDSSYQPEFLTRLCERSDRLCKNKIANASRITPDDSIGIKFQGYNPNAESNELAEQKIRNCLKARGMCSISFNDVRKLVNEQYDDQKLKLVIDQSEFLIPATFVSRNDGMQFTNLPCTPKISE